MAATDAIDRTRRDGLIEPSRLQRWVPVAAAMAVASLAGVAIVTRSVSDHGATRFAHDVALGSTILGVVLVFVCAVGPNGVLPYAMVALAVGEGAAEWHRRSAHPVASLVVGAWIVVTSAATQIAVSRRHPFPRQPLPRQARSHQRLAHASNVYMPATSRHSRNSFLRVAARIVLLAAGGGAAVGALSAALFFDGSEAISPGWIGLGLAGGAGLLLLVHNRRE